MSAKPIGVDDLVMVVRGHDCMVRAIGGVPFTVSGIVRVHDGGWFCNRCYTESAGPNVNGASGHPLVNAVPLTWLIKINPPAIDDSVETREEITA